MASRVRCYGTRILSPTRSLRQAHNHHIQKINPFLYLVDHKYPILSDDLKWAAIQKTCQKQPYPQQLSAQNDDHSR